MVPKRDSGDWLLCRGYHAVNSQTVPDRYLLSHIQDLVANFVGTTIFSQIDLVKAYHQILVVLEDVPKVAIITSG